MGRATIDTCDLCGAPLNGTLGSRYEKIAPKNGLCIEVGYSLGGWGYRQNHIVFSGEVCTSCYDLVMPSVDQLKAAMEACRTTESSVLVWVDELERARDA
jgi:hypothetical protein